MANDGEQLTAAVLHNIEAEARRIEEDAIHSAKSHFEASGAWAYRHLYIGLPTALVAAAAGVAALKDRPVLAAIMALLVAASSTVFTFLNPKERHAAHLSAGNSYKALQNDARIFRLIDCANSPNNPELIEALKKLNGRRNVLNAESPQFSRKAFRRAREGINAGEAAYAADQAQPPPAA